MLATNMRRMCNNNLEIRMAGSSCRTLHAESPSIFLDKPGRLILLIQSSFKHNGTDVLQRFAKKVHFYSCIGVSSVANWLLLWSRD